MSAGPNQLDLAEAAMGDFPRVEQNLKEKPDAFKSTADSHSLDSEETANPLVGPNGEQYPTEEELNTLRRVYGKIPWTFYTIAFVELCERFSYYGTTAVFVNFIQQPLPPGSTTGAAGTDGQPGALGMGQRAATGLTLFNSFWAYLMPLFGAYIADEYWGRYLTIQVAIGIAIVGHVILIISAIPAVLHNSSGALAAFIIGLIIFGVGVGGFKSNISPLIAEQYEAKQPRPTIQITKSGERTIVDPVMTISRIYMYFYLMINVGALIGQIGMVYAEKYVGFWLSFVLPTCMFLICPFVMWSCRKSYVKRPPTGSVLAKAMHLWVLAMKGKWSINPVSTVKNMRAPGFWDNVKPSRIAVKPVWMTFDDAWVDEVRRGFKACTVFLWYPLWWLSYTQMTNNLVSQAASMKLNGVPNDVVNNLDPFALIIFIPIFDQVIYPLLAKMGIHFTPIKKITAGFVCGALSMACAAIIQHYIYAQSPCGNQASTCETPPNISVWAQTPAYILIAFSEIFASITGLEYAFTKAPKNMRSLVTAVFLFTSAISSALSQAFVSLSADPLLVWLYIVVAIISTVGGIGFWLAHRKLDQEEDALNNLPESTYKGRKNSVVDVETLRAEQERQRRISDAQGLQPKY